MKVYELYEGRTDRDINSDLQAKIKKGMTASDPQKAYYQIFSAINKAVKEITDSRAEKEGLRGGAAIKLYNEIKNKSIAKINQWMIEYYKVEVGPNPTTKEIVYTYKQKKK